MRGKVAKRLRKQTGFVKKEKNELAKTLYKQVKKEHNKSKA